MMDVLLPILWQVLAVCFTSAAIITVLGVVGDRD